MWELVVRCCAGCMKCGVCRSAEMRPNERQYQKGHINKYEYKSILLKISKSVQLCVLSCFEVSS